MTNHHNQTVITTLLVCTGIALLIENVAFWYVVQLGEVEPQIMAAAAIFSNVVTIVMVGLIVRNLQQPRKPPTQPPVNPQPTPIKVESLNLNVPSVKIGLVLLGLGFVGWSYMTGGKVSESMVQAINFLIVGLIIVAALGFMKRK